VAAQTVIGLTSQSINKVNELTSSIFHTRGGRIGSGMGSVIEGVWGFCLNACLKQQNIHEYKLGWIYGHTYNDFACVVSDEPWDPETKQGELFRIEAKSMVNSADESKAHFDRLSRELVPLDILAVFLWDWQRIKPGELTVYPAIVDAFVGRALPVAHLRDEMHIQRGGSFVTEGNCPDGCSPQACIHLGEPLNANGVRERRTGPQTATARSVSYAANFGGLLRMLGCRSEEGRSILNRYYNEDETVRRFLDFMRRNFNRVSQALE
jgi:hypothetical protein